MREIPSAHRKPRPTRYLSRNVHAPVRGLVSRRRAQGTNHRMCGILGAYSREGMLPEQDRFALALDKLRLRGPDDSGLWADNHVRLGHRRLAIVELSAAGHQPMESQDGRYVVVFNGEIYNHL